MILFSLVAKVRHYCFTNQEQNSFYIIVLKDLLSFYCPDFKSCNRGDCFHTCVRSICFPFSFNLPVQNLLASLPPAMGLIWDVHFCDMDVWAELTKGSFTSFGKSSFSRSKTCPSVAQWAIESLPS